MTIRLLEPGVFHSGRVLALVFVMAGITLAFAREIPAEKNPSSEDFMEVPTIKWTFKTKAPLFASPIVNGNLIYIGGLDSILYAIDMETGQEKWRFRTQGEIRSDICIGNDRLYLNGGDGKLYALNKSTGKLQWTFQTKGERKYDFADYFHAAPVWKDGMIYLGSGDGYLYALNADSGTCIWSFYAGDIIHTTPAVDNDKIFFGSFNGYIYALAKANGELIWKFKTVGHRYFPQGEVQGSPAVSNNLVIVGARDYNVYALDQNSGFCHWNKAFARGWGLSNQIQDSILYTGTADERILIASDPETGKVLWNIEMEFLVFGNNAYSNNLLYIGTTNGKLHGINKLTGEKLWSFETETYRNNRSGYFKPDGTYRDDIYTIIKSNEQFLEVECELGGIFSTPYVSRDNIVFSSTNGTLYCLKRSH
jgi:eukaryotic-like serine/threonine-protein kinase